MAALAHIEVEGAKELASLLRRIGDKDIQRELRSAHRQAAEVVAVRARGKVPVRTGRLRSSIRGGASLSSAFVRAGGGKRTPYGSAVHWGRRKGNVGAPPGNRKGTNVVARNPFLWDAGNESIDLAAVIYERAVGKVFDQIHSTVGGR